MTKTEEKRISEFISRYKNLEKELSESDAAIQSVFNYAASLPEQEQKKMHFCRNTRNFLQHEEEAFVIPSDEMIAFLDMHIQKIVKSRSSAKDIMKRVTPLKETDTLETAAKKLDKYPAVPVVDSDGVYLGVMTDSVIRKAASAGLVKKKIKVVRDMLSECSVCPPDNPARNLTDDIYVVTDTGEKNGKYKGMILSK